MRGFSLLELMIVVAIIVILTIIAVPNYRKFIAKSKRAECYVNLAALATAQEMYHAEHGTYTNKLQGPDSLGFAPMGNAVYSYGFAGAPGTNSTVGTGGKGIAMPSIAQVTLQGFVAAAVADIDGDGSPDIITIDQNRVVTIVQDDLK